MYRQKPKQRVLSHLMEDTLEDKMVSMKAKLDITRKLLSVFKGYPDPMLQKEIESSRGEIRQNITQMMQQGISFADIITKFGGLIYKSKTLKAEENIDNFKKKTSEKGAHLIDLVNEDKQLYLRASKNFTEQQANQNKYSDKYNEKIASRNAKLLIDKQVIPKAKKAVIEKETAFFDKLKPYLEQLITQRAQPAPRSGPPEQFSDQRAFDLMLQQRYSGEQRYREQQRSADESQINTESGLTTQLMDEWLQSHEDTSTTQIQQQRELVHQQVAQEQIMKEANRLSEQSMIGSQIVQSPADLSQNIDAQEIVDPREELKQETTNKREIKRKKRKMKQESTVEQAIIQEKRELVQEQAIQEEIKELREQMTQDSIFLQEIVAQPMIQLKSFEEEQKSYEQEDEETDTSQALEQLEQVKEDFYKSQMKTLPDKFDAYDQVVKMKNIDTQLTKRYKMTPNIDHKRKQIMQILKMSIDTVRALSRNTENPRWEIQYNIAKTILETMGSLDKLVKKIPPNDPVEKELDAKYESKTLSRIQYQLKEVDIYHKQSDMIPGILGEISAIGDLQNAVIQKGVGQKADANLARNVRNYLIQYDDLLIKIRSLELPNKNWDVTMFLKQLDLADHIIYSYKQIQQLLADMPAKKPTIENMEIANGMMSGIFDMIAAYKEGEQIERLVAVQRSAGSTLFGSIRTSGEQTPLSGYSTPGSREMTPKLMSELQPMLQQERDRQIEQEWKYPDEVLEEMHKLLTLSVLRKDEKIKQEAERYGSMTAQEVYVQLRKHMDRFNPKFKDTLDQFFEDNKTYDRVARQERVKKTVQTARQLQKLLKEARFQININPQKKIVEEESKTQ